MSVSEYSCVHCGTFSCKKQGEDRFPPFCLTKNDIDGRPSEEVIAEFLDHMNNDPEDSKIIKAAAETEALNFCKYTRVEEVMDFARRMGVKKIGIASCHGLMRETRIFTKILQANGFDYIVAGCKVGNLDKTAVGIDDSKKINPGTFEPVCNPILQAKILNAHHTDLNVIIGLCVGHDSLFMKYSEAIMTTLITKDRVLGNCPSLALNTAEEYRPWLLDPSKTVRGLRAEACGQSPAPAKE